MWNSLDERLWAAVRVADAPLVRQLVDARANVDYVRRSVCICTADRVLAVEDRVYVDVPVLLAPVVEASASCNTTRLSIMETLVRAGASVHCRIDNNLIYRWRHRVAYAATDVLRLWWILSAAAAPGPDSLRVGRLLLAQGLDATQAASSPPCSCLGTFDQTCCPLRDLATCPTERLHGSADDRIVCGHPAEPVNTVLGWALCGCLPPSPALRDRVALLVEHGANPHRPVAQYGRPVRDPSPSPSQAAGPRPGDVVGVRYDARHTRWMPMRCLSVSSKTATVRSMGKDRRQTRVPLANVDLSSAVHAQLSESAVQRARRLHLDSAVEAFDQGLTALACRRACLVDTLRAGRGGLPLAVIGLVCHYVLGSS